MLLVEALREAAARLGGAGVDRPEVDARLIAGDLLGCPPLEVGLRGREECDASFLERYRALIERRATREPLHYILGAAPFGAGELKVGEGVFIPRPETEILADRAARLLADKKSPVAVDLCAGAGSLATYLAREVEGASVHAVEADPKSVPWLRRNAEPLGVECHEGDARDAGVLSELRGAVDVVVANPPYVPDGAEVAPEVRFDPDVAVYGGPTGVEFTARLLPVALGLLKPGGWFGVEHDDTTAEATRVLLQDAGFVEVGTLRDLAGRERFAVGRRPEEPGD